MPLVTALFLSYAAGLWMGFGGFVVSGLSCAMALLCAAVLGRGTTAFLAALTLLLGTLVGRDTRQTDVACASAIRATSRATRTRSSPRAASWRANSRPMPAVAPVTSAVVMREL